MGKRPQQGDAEYPYKRKNPIAPPRKFNPDEPVTLPARALLKTPLPEHINQAMHAVVTIEKFGHGSGFFITPQGHILTNAHVVGGAHRIRIRTHNNKQTLITEVLRIDKPRDVALLKLEDKPQNLAIHPLPIRANLPNIGSDVYAISTPLSSQTLQNTLTKGIISAHRKDVKILGITQSYIQADVDIHAGNSGGPLLDQNGNIIAITLGGASNNNFSTGLNHFIPIGEALEKLDINTPAP